MMMTKTTEIYYPDGRVLVQEWEDGTRPAYEWLSKAVEGYIETVDRFMENGGPNGTVQAYANEEGLLLGLRGNIPGMKAINWPEPPGGWDSFDPDNVGDPPPPVLIVGRPTPEQIEMMNRWSPIVGPVLVMRGWRERDYDNEKGVNPDSLGEPRAA